MSGAPTAPRKVEQNKRKTRKSYDLDRKLRLNQYTCTVFLQGLRPEPLSWAVLQSVPGQRSHYEQAALHVFINEGVTPSYVGQVQGRCGEVVPRAWPVEAKARPIAMAATLVITPVPAPFAHAGVALRNDWPPRT